MAEILLSWHLTTITTLSHNKTVPVRSVICAGLQFTHMWKIFAWRHHFTERWSL